MRAWNRLPVDPFWSANELSPPDEDYVAAVWGRSAYLVSGALQIILIPIGFPVALLTPPITLIAGCLTALTLGLLGFAFIIMWAPFA